MVENYVTEWELLVKLPRLHVGIVTAEGFHEAASGPSDTQSRLCNGYRITSNPGDMRWNILHAFWNILELSAFILEHFGTF